MNANDPAGVKVYADSSGIEGKVGAAAVLYRGDTQVQSLQCHMGTLKDHTTYGAKVVGIILGLELLKQE